MMLRFTSRGFVAARAIFAKLEAASFAPHPVTGELPAIEFGAPDLDMGAESVAVSLHVDESPEIEWRVMSPPGADEVMLFDIVGRSYVSATETSAAVHDRLESLADTIQSIFFDTSTDTVVAIGYDGERVDPRVVRVVPVIVPADLGWIGAVTVTVRTHARI